MLLKKHIFNKNLFFFILLIAFLGIFYPCVYGYLFYGEKRAIITISIAIFWVALYFLLYGKRRLKILNKVFTLIILFQSIYIYIWGVILQSTSIQTNGFNFLLSYFFILIVINTIDTDYLLKAFIRVNIISLVLIIIGIFLLSMGLLKHLNTFNYINDSVILNYGFFFVKAMGGETDYMTLRPSGFYDESGSLSFIVMLLLLLNKKYYNNKYWEYSLLLIPLITTSLAHIITVIIYILLFYSSRKRMKYIIPIFIFIIFVVLFLEYGSGTNEGIARMRDRTIGRIENIIVTQEDNGSRDGGLKHGPIIFEKYYLGISPEDVRQKYPEFVHETFWGPILYYGIFGIFIFFLPFIYLLISFIKNKDILSLKFLFLIGINLLQRPYYNISFIFMILIYLLFFEQKHNIIKKI